MYSIGEGNAYGKVPVYLGKQRILQPALVGNHREVKQLLEAMHVRLSKCFGRVFVDDVDQDVSGHSSHRVLCQCSTFVQGRGGIGQGECPVVAPPSSKVLSDKISGSRRLLW